MVFHKDYILFLFSAYCCACSHSPKIDDLTTNPKIPTQKIEKVASLDFPPGNIAVSKSGRVFFSYHPDALPEIKVAEWVDGKAIPFPNREMQEEGSGIFFSTVLSVRIDRQNRLWVLDHGDHGKANPKILSFDIDTRKIIDHYKFPESVAGPGSMLNDFQVTNDGKFIFIANSAVIGQLAAQNSFVGIFENKSKPSIVVYDVESKSAYSVLVGHESVLDAGNGVYVDENEVKAKGFFRLTIGIDSIALDRKNDWLYYAPLNAGKMYRVPVKDLIHNHRKLDRKVELYANITLSDGITTDRSGGIFITDIEHSAILRLGRDGSLVTLLKDKSLRWPDGFSFGPNGWLYFTCSSLQHILPKVFNLGAVVEENRPYHIYRFKPGTSGYPGH